MNLIASLALLTVSLTSLQVNINALQSPYNAPEQPISQKIDEWLIKLEVCESGQKDLTILDTNNKYSYGYFMFQRATFDKYGELYNLPHDNIHSFDEQFSIAHKMIEDGGWSNWYNCVHNTVGLPPNE